MNETKFPIIEVEGQPFAMGYQHGAEFRDLVALSLEMFRRLIVSDLHGIVPAGVAGPSFEQVMDVAAEAIPLTNEYAPDVVEEMRGVAEGSGFTFKEIFALNSHLDIMERIGSHGGRLEGGGDCSSYAVSNGATIDGDTYVGWNADDNGGWLRSSVLIKGKPTEGPPFIFWNFAGCIGRPGMNPYLALSANGLSSSDSSLGVPYCIVCRKVLQQRSVEDAVKVISGVKRMAGLNYTLGDAAGNVAAVETTARRTVVIPGVNGKVVHTNHFVADEIPSCEMAPGDKRVNSQKRLERLRELLMEKEAGSITLEDLKAVHRDHENRPDSICGHGHDKYPGVMTLASLIMQPGRSRMLVAYGHPCEHKFVEYTL